MKKEPVGQLASAGCIASTPSAPKSDCTEETVAVESVEVIVGYVVIAITFLALCVDALANQCPSTEPSRAIARTVCEFLAEALKLSAIEGGLREHHSFSAIQVLHSHRQDAM